MFAGVDSDGAIAGAALPDISAAESETLFSLWPLIPSNNELWGSYMGFYTTGRFPGQYGEVLRLQNVHPLLLKILYPHQVYAHLTTFFTGPLFLVRKIGLY